MKSYGKAPDWDFFEKYKAEIVESVENVKWAKDRGCRFDDEDFVKVLKIGDAEILNEIPMPGYFYKFDRSSLIPHAIRSKNLPCLKVLVKKGLVPDSTDMSIAVSSGRLGIIEYLWSIGCSDDPTSSRLICCAIEDLGDLDIVKFLVSKGYKINESTCAVAGTRGRLEILQWLRSIDCPWDKYTVDYSIRNHTNEEVVEWAMENGCPFDYTEAEDRWANEKEDSEKED